jgi:hypothetical protein
VDCRGFELWLDEGRPEARRREAEAHASACTTCAALSLADAELDVALEARVAPTPANFTERVLARVATSDRAAGPLPIDPELLLPWSVQLLREPAALVGLAFGAIWAGSGPFLVPAIRSAVPTVLGALSTAAGHHPAASSPLVILAVTVPLAAGAAWALYRFATAAAARLSGVSP